MNTNPTPVYSMLAPTAQSLFGSAPWITSGIGPFNPQYFATPETARKVALILNGIVVQRYAITPFGPFQQNQPNLMVLLADGTVHNAGVIAALYDHGYSQVTIEQMICDEIGIDAFRSAVLPRVELQPEPTAPPAVVVEPVYQIGDAMNNPVGDVWPVGHIETDPVTGNEYQNRSDHSSVVEST